MLGTRLAMSIAKPPAETSGAFFLSVLGCSNERLGNNLGRGGNRRRARGHDGRGARGEAWCKSRAYREERDAWQKATHHRRRTGQRHQRRAGHTEIAREVQTRREISPLAFFTME